MKSPRHRNTQGVSQALRFNDLLAAGSAKDLHRRLPMPARWHQARPAHVTPRRLRKTAWMPRLAGVLAFGALAFGVFLAGSDTCAAHETGGGNYSQSTLAPITDSGADATPVNARGGACKRKRKAGRFAHQKTAP